MRAPSLPRLTRTSGAVSESAAAASRICSWCSSIYCLVRLPKLSLQPRARTLLGRVREKNKEKGKGTQAGRVRGDAPAPSQKRAHHSTMARRWRSWCTSGWSSRGTSSAPTILCVPHVLPADDSGDRALDWFWERVAQRYDALFAFLTAVLNSCVSQLAADDELLLAVDIDEWVVPRRTLCTT